MVADDVITTTEAGTILGVSQARVRQMIASGVLKAEKLGTDAKYFNMLKRSEVLAVKKARDKGKKAA